MQFTEKGLPGQINFPAENILAALTIFKDIPLHMRHPDKRDLIAARQLTTSFNFYASWWAGWIMEDIQNNILQIVKQRAEHDH